MASSLINYWNYGSKYCGIEYGSNASGQNNISVLTANKKKGEYEIEKTFQTDKIEECAQKLKKYQHAYLDITNNQVLIKQTSSTGPAAKVVSSAFPNVDLKEFYYEIFSNYSGSIVALCRKEQVHQIINSFEEQNIRIIGFSLGFFSIQNLFGVIKDQEIYLTSYTVNNNGKEITSFERAGKENDEIYYTAGDTTVSSKFLLPLSAIFNYYTENIYTVSNCDNINRELKKEHHQKVFFRKGVVTACVLLLIMLLINFVFFTSYYAELQQMTGRHEIEISAKLAYDKKFKEVIAKERIVQNILKNSNSQSSLYLNRIILTKPASVLFNQLHYQPLQKQIKENEPIRLEKDTIYLGGESTNENEFSQWIKDLEEISWIEEVKVSHYGFNSPGTSEFLLTLNLKENEAIN